MSALLAAVCAGLLAIGLVRARRRRRARDGGLAATDAGAELRERLAEARAVGPDEPDGAVSGRLDAIAADLAELDALVRAEEARVEPSEAIVPVVGEAAEAIPVARTRVHDAARAAVRRMRG